MNGIFHGGGLDAAIEKFGGKRSDWLDLSTGINPHPYPVSALSDTVWQQLPDQQALADLLKVARNYYGVRDQIDIVAGAGTQAIIERLPQVLQVKHVAVVSPTYGEHGHVWERAGAKLTRVTKVVDCPSDAEALVLVNPNNPDGRSWQPADLLFAAKEVKYLIVDEAFVDTMPDNSVVPIMPENAIVLRSFGKFFGLAGVRLGFAIADPEIAGKLARSMGPWAISGPALALGKMALGDGDWITKTRGRLEESSKAISRLLHAKELELLGSTPLFVYAAHPKAAALHKHLAKNHILVRPFEDMPDRLRFGLCKDDAAFNRLTKVLSSYG